MFPEKTKNSAHAGLSSLIALLVLLLGASSLLASETCVASAGQSGTQSFPLMAGQNTEAGSVSVTVNGDQLIVTYQTMGGWKLYETHLWLGTGVPPTSAPGQFPYKTTFSEGVTLHSYSVSLSSMESPVRYTCPADPMDFTLAAHAVVKLLGTEGEIIRSETAWSQGNPIDLTGNWSMYSTFRLSCKCIPDDDPETFTLCETAFARLEDNARCFADYGISRWGWTNGPFMAGVGATVAEMDLIAGAGGCDVSKGTLAGSLALRYLDGDARVVFTAAADHWLAETHLYVGKDPIPVVKRGSKTSLSVAPGQYPYKMGNLEEGTMISEYMLANVREGFYLIGHAVVCHEEPLPQEE